MLGSSPATDRSPDVHRAAERAAAASAGAGAVAGGRGRQLRSGAQARGRRRHCIGNGLLCSAAAFSCPFLLAIAMPSFVVVWLLCVWWMVGHHRQGVRAAGQTEGQEVAGMDGLHSQPALLAHMVVVSCRHRASLVRSPLWPK